MPAGRPLKFKTIAQLQKQIDAYFESCWIDVPLKSSRGKVVETERQQIKPYTITGLALALDTSRQTLVNYEEKEQFFDAIKRAKLRCENFLEEGMLLGKLQAAPAIFNAKNNYGWRDQQEHTHEVGATLADLMREPHDKGTASGPNKG